VQCFVALLDLLFDFLNHLSKRCAYLAVCEVLDGVVSRLATEQLTTKRATTDAVEFGLEIEVVDGPGLPPFGLHVFLKLS